MNQNDPKQRPLRSQSRPTRRFSRTEPSARFARATPHLQQAREQASSRCEAFETFAQSVSCLLGDSDPTSNDREALVSLVRQSFPEFTRAKQSLTAAQERQMAQVQRLGPELLTNASFLTEPNPEVSKQNEIIDESARIMWELSRIDEQIEALQERINLLQHQIITWVKWDEPNNARAVRWALERA